MLALVIREVPTWMVAPFLVILAGALGWATAWILRSGDRN